MKDETYFISEEQLNEKKHISLHYRDVTSMARVHKSILNKNLCQIIRHETRGDGSHIIDYITPTKKTRRSTIICVYDTARVKTKIIDVPLSNNSTIHLGDYK